MFSNSPEGPVRAAGDAGQKLRRAWAQKGQAIRITVSEKLDEGWKSAARSVCRKRSRRPEIFRLRLFPSPHLSLFMARPKRDVKP